MAGHIYKKAYAVWMRGRQGYLAGARARAVLLVACSVGWGVIAPARIVAAPAVTYNPYFSVQGGDVLAGASIGSAGAPCDQSIAPANPNAGIVGWNSGNPAYLGAGTMYAAYAASVIQDFITHQGVSGVGAIPPSAPGAWLSFSNDDTITSPYRVIDTGGTYSYYGGLFDQMPCIGYWPDAAALAGIGQQFNNGTLNGNGSVSGQYYNPSDSQINSVTVARGKHFTLYVDGNLYIHNDIDYDTGPWASTSDIPSLKVIVHGNIYIDPGVQRLSGLYVAIPRMGIGGMDVSTGIISTCANASGSVSTTDVTFYQTCDNHLDVYGSFIANQVHLLRSGGDVGGAAAETFHYTPELWLNNDGVYDDKFTSVVGLPPIL